MKIQFKVLIAVALSLCMASSAFAAAGTITQALTTVCEPSTTNCVRVLTVSCTFGTGADATTALSLATTSAITAKLKGWGLLLGTTYAGSTAPTALYDIYLRETVGATANAVDILGGGGMDRPGVAGTSSQFKPIVSTSYLNPGLRPVLNTLTTTASGNAVASGNTTVQFIFLPLNTQ